MSEGLSGLLEKLVVRFKAPDSEWGQHYDQETGLVEWFVDMGVPVESVGNANLISSRRADYFEERHALLFDFDFHVHEYDGSSIAISKQVRVSRLDNLRGALALAEIRLAVEEVVGNKASISLVTNANVYVVPSSTTDHKHVYIDMAVDPKTVDTIVIALEKAGLIEPGIVRGWNERGVLCLRKPGVVKGVETP